MQQRLRKDGVLARVKPMGELLGQSLRRAFGEHPHVGDIRGRGLFWALELVAERGSRNPFDPALQVHARIKQEALKAGLLCYPMGGTIDGERGDHVLLAPPFIIEPSQIEELVHKLETAIQPFRRDPWRWTEVPPSLEDVFIHLMRERGGQQAQQAA